MRYCKDCTNMEWQAAGQPICRRFKKEFVISENAVFGPRIGFSAPECTVARGERGQCGPQARFFEARYGSDAWREEQQRDAGKVVMVPAGDDSRPWWKFW